MSDRITLTVASTHLYRGARLEAADTGRLTEGPAALSIAFRDGVRIDAEWLQNDEGGFAVAAPAFRTSAGQEIAAKTWRVARIEPRGDGCLVILDRRLS